MNWKWINIFLRDLFLSAALLGMNFLLNYQSWFAAWLLGMQMVLMAWHLHDFIKLNKELDDATIRHTNNSRDFTRNIRNVLQ